MTAPGPRTPEEYELRFAGVKAHNRWLADFCREAPNRWAGFAQLLLEDVEAAIAEVRWAKEAGTPRRALAQRPRPANGQPLLPALRPAVGRRAPNSEMPVHRHTNFPTESVEDGGPASALVGMTEMQFYVMRAIGHMILSGVFERHPDLKFVITEITSASQVLPYLAGLDTMLKVTNLGEHSPLYEHITDAIHALKLSPSEYFARNCFLAGPTHDLRQAHDVGVPNLMWGADFPHSEGTHPFTVEAIRVMLWDLPEDELDVILATRAATSVRVRPRRPANRRRPRGAHRGSAQDPTGDRRLPGLPRADPLHDLQHQCGAPGHDGMRDRAVVAPMPSEISR